MNDIQTVSKIQNLRFRPLFSRDFIRYFAIICMTLDHIAWWFIPFHTPTAQVMHFFGRMTAPIMCFFVAEGFHYTKDIRRYFARMGIFAILSQIPFFLLGENELNMLFTLFFSLAAVAVYEKREWNPALRTVIILALIVACHFSDWDVFGILWVLGFHVFRENRIKKAFSFIGVWVFYYFYAVYINVTSYGFEGLKTNIIYSIYSTGSLFALLIVLSLYNGRKSRFSKFSKWFMYIYYPAHLMVIWALYKY